MSLLQKLSIITIALVVSGCGRTERFPETLSHSAYVWQRLWSDELRSVIEEDSTFQSLHLLTYQIEPDGSLISITIDREFLSKEQNHNFTAVIRIASTAPQTAWDSLPSLIEHLQSENQPQWKGVQIDHDSPESKLLLYRDRLRELRKYLPEQWKLSITALPTWCNSHALKSVVKAVDYSVIQVHSVDDPREGLFNSAKADWWIREYSEITNRPFYVALPCYGSKVYLNDNGTVAGVESESPRADILWLPSEEFTVDPVDVDLFLTSIESEPVAHLQGFVWFRLPTTRDFRSWSKETLDAVINRQEITPDISLVTTETNGTIDIAVRNDGYGNSALPTIIVEGSVPFSDPLYDYGRRHEAGRTIFYPLTKKVATHGDEIPVGWVRGDSSMVIQIVNFGDI